LAGVDGDVDGIGAGVGEGELLEVEDEVACGEEEVFGEFDFEGGFHGGDDGLAILIDEKDADGVEALLLFAKEDAQGDGALGMDGGKGAGDDGIEDAEEAEFSVVIGRGIAEGGDLNIHGAKVREAEGICNPSRV